jgi:hypothetical protein
VVQKLQQIEENALEEGEEQGEEEGEEENILCIIL